jgi:hypothetical protein
MLRWVFRDYVHPNGNNPILKWYAKELSAQEQADMDTLLTTLERTKSWGLPDYRALQGAQKGLGEIRWKGGQKRPLRLIGFFGTESGQFTILVGCTHDNDKYYPANALSTALARMRELKRGIGGTCEHEIETDPEA